MTTITLPHLLRLSLDPVRRWWYRQLETHYLICAEVEAAQAKAAQANEAYFQKQAVFARSASRESW